MARIVGLFLKNGPERLRAAREGLASGDLCAVERAFHSLRSSAGHVGASRLAEICGRLENSQGPDEMAAGLDEAEAEFVALVPLLSAEVG